MSIEHLTDQQLREYHLLYSAGVNKSTRFETCKLHQYDLKFAYHLIRLFDECEQILTEGDLDLMRAREVMKAIRRGEWTEREIRKWVTEKERALEVAFTNCKLPDKPPEEPLRQLLLQCLEEHYGSLKDVATETEWAETALRQIDTLLNEHRKRLYGG